MRGILTDCIAEMVDRKVLWIYAVVTGIGILSVVVSRSIELQFQTEGMDLQQMNEMLGNPLMKGYNSFMYFLVFLSVLATAGLVPNMLARGRADFYLSKPLSRKALLLNKVFAVWVVYGAIMVFVMLIEFVAGGLVYGMYDSGIVYIILTNLLAFFIWLSVTAFAGVVSGSSAMSMMAAFLVWVLQKILAFHNGIKELIDAPIVEKIIDGLYYIVPKTGEISDLADSLVGGNSVDWMPLYSSLAFAAVLLYVTIYLFNRKDY